MSALEQEADKLAGRVERLAARNKLPKGWLGRPDHLALLSGAGLYDQVIEEFALRSDNIYETQLPGKRLAVVKLTGGVALRGLGTVNLLEVVEDDKAGLEHAEFVTSLAAVRYKFGPKLLHEAAGEYDWLSYRFRNGQSVKFTNRPSGELLKQAKGIEL